MLVLPKLTREDLIWLGHKLLVLQVAGYKDFLDVYNEPKLTHDFQTGEHFLVCFQFVKNIN